MELNPEKKVTSETFSKELEREILPTFLYGGFWLRACAYLFDLLIIRAGTVILLNLLVYRVFGIGVAQSRGVEILRLLLFLLYFFTTSLFLQGQTLGKILFRLRTVSLKQGYPFFLTMLVRELAGRVIFYYFPIVAVFLVFTRKRQHVVDLLADTVVVNEGKLEEYSRFAASTSFKPEEEALVRESTSPL